MYLLRLEPNFFFLQIFIHYFEFQKEMFYGLPPFTATSQTELFTAIMEEEPTFDDKVSKQLLGLLWGLLRKRPRERLVYEQIKGHDFYESLDWEKIMRKEVVPPYKPKLKKATDTKYFAKEFTRQTLHDSVDLLEVSPSVQRKFDNFSWMNTDTLADPSRKK